jgi:hypothetical protein
MRFLTCGVLGFDRDDLENEERMRELGLPVEESEGVYVKTVIDLMDVTAIRDCTKNGTACCIHLPEGHLHVDIPYDTLVKRWMKVKVSQDPVPKELVTKTPKPEDYDGTTANNPEDSWEYDA